MTGTALLWVRSDLRLHDNEALVRAAEADQLLPVYAFDPHWYGTAEFGGSRSFAYEKTGAHRARFLRESVADLRSSLRAASSSALPPCRTRRSLPRARSDERRSATDSRRNRARWAPVFS